MKKNSFSRSIGRMILLVGVLFFLFICSQIPNSNPIFSPPWNSCAENNSTSRSDSIAIETKQKGAHIFGYLDSANLQPFIQNNIEWITLVPYGAQKDINSDTMIYYIGDSSEFRRRDLMWKTQIDLAHSLGFNIFLKPHIWLTDPSEGKWRSNIYPADEHKWKLWQKKYREFILVYARLAEQSNVELFCIGTELSRLSIEKYEYWVNLIEEVRSIYSGQFTYAANWHEEYEQITFWDKLDYIGIQAYFPLATKKYPTIEQLSRGWSNHILDMEHIHAKYQRKILFTEMGYKSTADGAIKPWQWLEHTSSQNKLVSHETQANCYKAFFNTVWNKSWFAGVHIWQLRSDFSQENEYNRFSFTPQGKPATQIITKGFE